MKQKTIQKQKYKIPYHALFYIEGELKLYQTYLARISEIEDEKRALTEQSRHISNIPTASSDKDKFATISIKLAELDNEKIEMNLRTHKIESGLNILSLECRTIIEKKYFWEKALTNEQAIIECGYENYRAKFYDLLTEGQYKIGVIFGVIL
jgi:hypothetical protein